MKKATLQIDTFQPGDADDFAALNLAWLQGYGLLEPADERQLSDPETHVFALGGEIFMARVGEITVGCCAAIPRPDGAIEVAKLAVERGARGHGIGRQLVHAALKFGQARHYTKAILTSNARLTTAIRLYESIGFRHAPVPANVPYATVDVYMELDLVNWTP
jgi:GNAT superfamily N-acetyltransferase